MMAEDDPIIGPTDTEPNARTLHPHSGSREEEMLGTCRH
jgi:hypothetical protein